MIFLGEPKATRNNVTVAFEKLDKELREMARVYDAEDPSVDMYEQECYLNAMYDWGYILCEETIATDTIYKIYDMEHTMICSFYGDEYDWRIEGDMLIGDGFEYSLMKGAPIHEYDVTEIICSKEYNPFIVYTKDNKYIIKIGDECKCKRYSPLEREYWDAYIDTCNHCIVTGTLG